MSLNLNRPLLDSNAALCAMDRTGRGMIVFLLMLKAGVAVGPLIASLFVTAQSYNIALAIAALFFTLSFLVSWQVARAARSRGGFPALELRRAI